MNEDRIVITGHTGGIGKAIFDKFTEVSCHKIIGMSRSNGYDIEKDFDKIVQEAAGADLFINNAYRDKQQLKLFHALKDKVKIIVNGGIDTIEKAREILDTNIFELLPNQPNRQQRINNFFKEFNSISSVKKKNIYDEIIYLTPDGDLLNQKTSNYFSTLNNIIIICGHYKGIDHRVRDHLITKEISIGEFVVSGGELPAAVLCDSIIRLLPGIIGDESSALSDTFQDNLVSPPIYTRPEVYKGLQVPKVLLSGNKKEIQKWNDEKSIERTKLLRPKLFDNE